MPRLDDAGAQPQPVAVLRAEHLDLRGVEAELVQPPQPLLEAEALV